MPEREPISRKVTLLIVSGLVLPVLSAILISYFKAERPPVAGHGLERYDNVSGVFSLQYPRFLKKVNLNQQPQAVVATFHNMPTANNQPTRLSFLQLVADWWKGEDNYDSITVVVQPIEPRTEPQQEPSSSTWEDPMQDQIDKENWEMVTSRRGPPPKRALYLEHRRPISVFFLSEWLYFIRYYELFDGYSLYAEAYMSPDTRVEFRNEIDQTFASMTVNLDAARRVIPSKHELARRERAKSVITVEVRDKQVHQRSTKEHQGPEEPGEPEEFVISWREVYTPTGISKPTKTVEALLDFADLSGVVKVRIRVTLKHELLPGVPFSRLDGFVHDESKVGSRWMRSTPLEKMQILFSVQSIVYADGTEEVLKP